jgi:hypothetical protein
VVTRAFWLGLILVVVLVSGLALAGLVWRAPARPEKKVSDTEKRQV